ncbi:hypothetical protein [Nocardia barduliensis]|uniref:hypothetical protein n=1 Tax=Nocardia barduliensis TaxID=2736643 RepID=UPI0015733B90|nr:hypothetical protein [Nocardia barduliensis]
MALPDVGNVLPDVQKAEFDPRWTLGSISGRAVGSRMSLNGGQASETRGMPLSDVGRHSDTATLVFAARCDRRRRDATEAREIQAFAAVFVPEVTQEVPVLEKLSASGVVEDIDVASRVSMSPMHTLSTSSANPSEAR